jgi:hypothetical protein
MAAVAPGTQAQAPAQPKKGTAADVAELWLPQLKSATDYQHWGGSPERSPDVAAYSFRVVGPTFEELWKHYAKLCGVKKQYSEKSFLVYADTGPNGSYVVSDRAAGDGKGGRGPSVFVLKTAAFTVTVTFVPDPGGESISGSLTAVIP